MGEGTCLSLSAFMVLQVSVQLPTSDTEATAQKDCYAPALHWADAIWKICLHR